MAADGFFETELTIAIRLFNTAFNYTVLVAKAVNTHLSMDGGRYPAKILIVLIAAVFFDPFNALGSEVGLDSFVDIIKDLKFILFQGSAGIAIFTASALALHQVAYKLCLNHIVTNQHIIYCDQESRI
jgi:hypothetical protein